MYNRLLHVLRVFRLRVYIVSRALMFILEYIHNPRFVCNVPFVNRSYFVRVERSSQPIPGKFINYTRIIIKYLLNVLHNPPFVYPAPDHHDGGRAVAQPLHWAAFRGSNGLARERRPPHVARQPQAASQ